MNLNDSYFSMCPLQLYTDDYEDDDRPLVIDTSVDNDVDADPSPEGAADNGDQKDAHSISLKNIESGETPKQSSMVNSLSSDSQPAGVTYPESHLSPCSGVAAMSPGAGDTPPTCSSPSSVKPAPGRRTKKPGVGLIKCFTTSTHQRCTAYLSLFE